jgi:hypothetical protein
LRPDADIERPSPRDDAVAGLHADGVAQRHRQDHPIAEADDLDGER